MSPSYDPGTAVSIPALVLVGGVNAENFDVAYEDAFRHGLTAAINLTDAITPADINITLLLDFDLNASSLVNYSYPVVDFSSRRALSGAGGGGGGGSGAAVEVFFTVTAVLLRLQESESDSLQGVSIDLNNVFVIVASHMLPANLEVQMNTELSATFGSPFVYHYVTIYDIVASEANMEVKIITHAPTRAPTYAPTPTYEPSFAPTKAPHTVPEWELAGFAWYYVALGCVLSVVALCMLVACCNWGYKKWHHRRRSAVRKVYVVRSHKERAASSKYDDDIDDIELF
jgi:hypothetical protein